jgi:virginiamycin B lyase
VTAPTVIAAATNGAAWFDADDSRVGRIDPSGRTQTSPIPEGDPYGLAAAPNGSMWFTAFDHIDRITPQGASSKSRPCRDTSRSHRGLAAGAGGRLWFTVFRSPCSTE